MDGTAYLVEPVQEQDAMGQWKDTGESKKEIYVTVQSAGRAEFFQAAQTGNRCDYVFFTSPLDYDGEKILEWNGCRYDIYRTYYDPKLDQMELYAEERTGITDGSQQAED